MPVRYPEARRQILVAIASLADSEYQARVWLDPKEFDTFDTSIHTLYDDWGVLPRPDRAIGVFLYSMEEAAKLADLCSRLDELIDKHGDAEDRIYLDDQRWSSVVAAAGAALSTMVRAGP